RAPTRDLRTQRPPLAHRVQDRAGTSGQVWLPEHSRSANSLRRSQVRGDETHPARTDQLPSPRQAVAGFQIRAVVATLAILFGRLRWGGGGPADLESVSARPVASPEGVAGGGGDRRHDVELLVQPATHLQLQPNDRLDPGLHPLRAELVPWRPRPLGRPRG